MRVSALATVLAANAFVVAFRVIVGIVLAVVITIVVAAPARHAAGMGHGPARRDASGGADRSSSPSASASGTGAPTGSLLHIVAIGIPATMAAAVVLDLLARPGSLAIGERAGLVVAPRPVRAVRARISVFRRYRELARLLRREGFGPFMSSADRAARSTDSQAIRLRRVLEEAGGVYVKLGQIAATRVDLLPADMCDELASCRTGSPPEPRGADRPGARGRAAATGRRDLRRVRLGAAGRGIDRPDPRARLRTGEAVVVKVQRPGHRGD